ncbi:MAG: type VI secretion system tip protein TssI/VgrG, partial [Pseudomonadota bacterium]
MSAMFSQFNRRARLDTVLGLDTLLLVKLDGTEELSGDFEWRIEAISTDPALDLNKLLGTHATVTADIFSGEKRYFDGIVAEAKFLGNLDSGNVYSLVLRPWLHVAGFRRNQRIFHDMTVVDIVTEVFDAYAALGSPPFEFEVTDDYPVLEYTVQYGETDADFCRRLLERFGISWHWDHTDGNHRMVLTDRIESLPGIGTRPYHGVAGTHLGDSEHFRLWESGSRMTTGAVRLTEYNFKMPSATQEVDQTGEVTYAHGDIESFDWPGDYLKQPTGRDVVERRVQEEQGQGPRIAAAGNVLMMGAGSLVVLTGDYLPGQTDNRFVCLKVKHSLRSQAYGTEKKISEDEDYSGTYVMMPDT